MRLPKLCGADIELGNFILGADDPGSTSFAASRALLRQIEGVPARRECFTAYPHSTSVNSQDRGRKFLASNGGCAYIDLNHLELCIPEVLSAYDHVACWHAMLRIAQNALRRANEIQPEGQPIQVLVNNCDNAGNSYGSHLNFLVSRQTWDNLFNRRMHQMLYLAAYQVSSIVFTGQGKVGSQNGRPPAAYQISQRADFFETLTGGQTTFNRPIVNSRDEPLCGISKYGSASPDTAKDYARLHVIFFDNSLCQVSALLKVGVMQLILAMIEAGCISPSLILDDPLEAVLKWSHDPSLDSRAELADGRELTAIELQLLFLEQAQIFAASGGFEAVVPRAKEILALWEDTLLKLRDRDFTTLAGRLDWVLKLQILQRARELRHNLEWSSPELMHLDQLYSTLDPSSGLYWLYERQGLVERVSSDEAIERFVSGPPDDTRAWTRTMLLRTAGPEAIEEVDWDAMEFRIRRNYWSTFRKVALGDPLRFNRKFAESSFRSFENLEDLLDSLESLTSSPAQTASLSTCTGTPTEERSIR
jgi:proteasome accessory factor A